MIYKILLMVLAILSRDESGVVSQNEHVKNSRKSLDDNTRWIGSSQEKRRKANKKLLKNYRRFK